MINIFFLVLILVIRTGQCQNLFKDGGYEENDVNTNWHCNGCKLTSVTYDKVSGKKAIKVTDRTQVYQGPIQTVNLKRNARYHVIWYIKQLNSIPEKPYQEFRISGSFKINDKLTIYPQYVMDHRVYPERGWVKLENYIQTPDRAFISGDLYLQQPDAGVEFLADAASVTFIPEDTEWKEKANQRIEKIRKSDIQFKLNAPLQANPHDLEIEIKLLKHGFIFGTEVTPELILAPKYAHFRELFQFMFNYATMASYFWQWSTGPREFPDYSDSSKALDILKQKGIPARGHNIFWDSWPFVPDWLKYLPPDDVKREVEHRIHYIANITKGKVESWDVSNEILHGEFYEKKMNDRFYCHKIFKLYHQLDPDMKLFLNDYQIVVNGTSTSAYLDQATEYKDNNVPVHALGIQSHFDQYFNPDPTVILKRLDHIGRAGLPLWITEMDVVANDEKLRSEWYDRLYRIYFSHPSISAIIVWGFWGPKHWIGDQASLVSGKDYQINAAGQAYLDLIYKEWTTHVTKTLSSSGNSFIQRGFHGDYEVVVRYKGSPIKYTSFTLKKGGTTVNIHITDLNANVKLPVVKSPLVYHRPTIQHTVISLGEYDIGSSTSSDASTLSCVNAWSAFSEVGDDKHVDAYCPQGYAMTGCSAMTKALTAKGDGASVETEHGVACRAWDGGGPKEYNSPVHAIARCCELTGLKCDYRRSAKPSTSDFDIVIETKCPNDKFATGCSAHNYNQKMDGIYPTTHSCRTQAEDNFAGNFDCVLSYVTCCSAPRMNCKVKKATFVSGHKIGDASIANCDSGWEMTGCHGISEDGGMSGSFIEGNKCLAFNGEVKTPGMAGVVAYATCCKVQ